MLPMCTSLSAARTLPADVSGFLEVVAVRVSAADFGDFHPPSPDWRLAIQTVGSICFQLIMPLLVMQECEAVPRCQAD